MDVQTKTKATSGVSDRSNHLRLSAKTIKASVKLVISSFDNTNFVFRCLSRILVRASPSKAFRACGIAALAKVFDISTSACFCFCKSIFFGRPRPLGISDFGVSGTLLNLSAGIFSFSSNILLICGIFDNSSDIIIELHQKVDVQIYLLAEFWADL